VSECEDDQEDLEEELKDEVKPMASETQENDKVDSEEPDAVSEEENENGLVDDDEKYYRPMVFTEYDDPIMKKMMSSSIFNMN
jgi:hypothetical protein